MQIGVIGLGRMGGNIVRRLMKAGHECVVYDNNPKAGAALAKEGAKAVESLEEMAAALKKPRAVWSMLPSGKITEDTVSKLGELFEKDDIIIDGGNSFYKDDIRRAKDPRREGRPLCRLRHLRRRLGRRSRLLHDDRRDQGCGRSPRSDLQDPGSGPWAIFRARRGARASIRAQSKGTSTPDPPAPGTSSRWCTTASNTA